MQHPLFSVLVAFIFISLISCKDKTETPTVEPPEDLTEQPTTVITDTLVPFDPSYQVTQISLSDLPQSALASPLKQLDYLEGMEVQVSNPEELVAPDIVTNFYPLGWSEGGNFGYAEFSDTYNSGYKLSYTIVNMISGDTLWHQTIYFAMVLEGTSEEEYYEMDAQVAIQVLGDESEETLFTYAWLYKEEAVISALGKAGIAINTSYEFQQGSTYDGVDFSIVREEEDTNENYPIRYFVENEKLGRRFISGLYFDSGPTEVAGILPSPHGKTIAVICRQKRQHFEMTNEIVPIPAGFSLE